MYFIASCLPAKILKYVTGMHFLIMPIYVKMRGSIWSLPVCDFVLLSVQGLPKIILFVQLNHASYKALILEWIMSLNTINTPTSPDLIFYLDIDLHLNLD